MIATKIIAICALSIWASASFSQQVPGYVPQNVVQLSASGSVEVQQDLLAISMTTTREGSDAGTVQTQLKAALDAALTEAKKAALPGQLDVRTGNFDILHRCATQADDRRKDAGEFLDCHRNQFGLLQKQLPIFGVRGQVVNCRTHDVGRRGDAAKRDVNHYAQIFLERRVPSVRVDYAFDDRIDHVAARWFLGAFFHQFAQVTEDDFKVFSFFLGSWCEGAPFDAINEHLEIREGNAHHILEKRPTRKQRAEFGDELAFTTTDETIDQFIDISTHARLVAGACFGAEKRVECIAPSRMNRWV